MGIITARTLLAAIIAVTFAISSGSSSYAASLAFGVVGGPIDLSANVSEAILPGGNIFQDSKPLFGTAPDPKQSAELLHISSTGINPSSHSNVPDAFSSSLAESN